MERSLPPFVLMLPMVLGACSGGVSGVPGDSEDRAPFHAIAEDEAVNVTGTEPFWGGQVAKGRFHYTTPNNPEGADVPVSRFAGRGGLSFSGDFEGKTLTLAITPGACSDGMSERQYPFVVTFRLGAELRHGCGWTKRQPWSGGE
ncbi:COG3650 family protein [Novosphingobium beihaiensis]|uniref:Lipoprotein n=1 Tax=Novosphingobium beihaiensis TaxID=2930389 RepID=A0ABT0BPH5_9SPHN|nr:hypothetical protein [Novosphingobium beihaiensis]MCJ2186599.1 hypothetical protein [Novosphingobium beihaiensis]